MATTPTHRSSENIPIGAGKWICWIMGVVAILLALIGFLGGEFIFGAFRVTAAHNLVYLIGGAILLGMGFSNEQAARNTAWTFAAIFLLVAILGFLMIPGFVDFFGMNMATNWLNLLIALVLGICAAISQTQERTRLARTAHHGPRQH